jgi:hypothetical protein
LSINLKSRIKLIVFITIISTFLFSYTLVVSGTENYSQNRVSSVKRPDKIAQIIDFSDLFLPGSNITISEYIASSLTNTFNLTVTSINTTHWFGHFDYSITEDIYTNPFTSPFDAFIERNPKTEFYKSTGYFNTAGLPSSVFDLWTNVSKFDLVSLPYKFTGEENSTYTVEGLESFFLESFGVFDAWKIKISSPSFPVNITTWLDKSSGLLLSTNYFIVQEIWYNLTRAEIPTLPQDYTGPILTKSNPGNESMKPGGTNLNLEFGSLYGIENITYSWDNNPSPSSIINSNIFQTVFPSSEGFHGLNIVILCKIGFISNIYLQYYTNNSLLGINLLNILNNSKIKGDTVIDMQIFSGNGTYTYNWDAEANSTVLEGFPITVSNPLIERTAVLTIYVKGNNTIEWLVKRYVFSIDNTPPILSVTNVINGSTLKGTVKIDLMANENSVLIYNLDNVGNNTVSLGENLTQSIFFSNLENGSHRLSLSISDEANNVNHLVFIFSVFTSSFNWLWNLELNTPFRIPFFNVLDELLFVLTITSKINQSFSMVTVFDNSTITLSEDIEILFKFVPEYPEEIMFLEFFFPHGSTSDTVLDVYEWNYWNSQSEEWTIIDTNYNNIELGWEATLTESQEVFALIKKSETITLTYEDTGGGIFAPSFTIETLIITLLILIVPKTTILKKNKKLR